MRLRWLTLLIVLPLQAQAEPGTPVLRAGVGGFTDRHSDGTGAWTGQILTADWFRDATGPWSFAAVRTQRPEGVATQITLGKDQTLGEASWGWFALGAGAGADFAARFRAEADLDLAVAGPWSLGLGAAWNAFGGGDSTLRLQAGPGWKGEVWSASLRVQHLRYQPGGFADTGFLADLRRGASNLKRWHSLRVAWGRGILEALESGGGMGGGTTSSAGTGRGWRRGTVVPAAGTGTDAAAVVTEEAPKEFLATFTSHLPLSRRVALRLEGGWGRREGQFNLWTAGAQVLVSF